jgi:hypothetical protein
LFTWSADIQAPDRSPSLVLEALGQDFDGPWHYKSPVTGR